MSSVIPSVTVTKFYQGLFTLKEMSALNQTTYNFIRAGTDRVSVSLREISRTFFFLFLEGIANFTLWVKWVRLAKGMEIGRRAVTEINIQ